MDDIKLLNTLRLFQWLVSSLQDAGSAAAHEPHSIPLPGTSFLFRPFLALSRRLLYTCATQTYNHLKRSLVGKSIKIVCRENSGETREREGTVESIHMPTLTLYLVDQKEPVRLGNIQSVKLLQ